MQVRGVFVALFTLFVGCGGPEPVAPTPTAARVELSPPIDEKAVADATGSDKVEKAADGVVKANWPRSDVEVSVDGWKMPPFMGLTSWVAFAPGRKGVADAMVMGDLVLFEDEVNVVMSKLLEAGLSVTALHNHFFFDNPKVFFMHVGGEGKVAELGAAVRAALAATKEVRKNPIASSSGSPKLPEKSALDAASIDAVLGTKTTAKDGMLKGVWGKKTVASCGCDVGKTMGVNTWAAFAGSEDNAVVDGDFAVAENELQPVLKSLRASGISIVAIHHHMSGEHPRILFLHYWGRGHATELAGSVKKALELTGWTP